MKTTVVIRLQATTRLRGPERHSFVEGIYVLDTQLGVHRMKLVVASFGVH